VRCQSLHPNLSICRPVNRSASVSIYSYQRSSTSAVCSIIGGAQTRRTDIVRLVDTDVLEIHPNDAGRLHIENGETVRLVSARSEATLPAAVSDRVRPGELFTSFHFPSTNINALLSSSADENSKCPEYKVSAVRVEKCRAPVPSMVNDLSGPHWKLIP